MNISIDAYPFSAIFNQFQQSIVNLKDVLLYIWQYIDVLIGQKTMYPPDSRQLSIIQLYVASSGGH